jgi:hypothetical protein
MAPEACGDTNVGMNAVENHRGNALLLAHCRSLEPSRISARERLEEALGEELASKLVAALCSPAPTRRGGLRRVA